MIRHFFKITLRNLNRKRQYVILNIGGLTIGLACFIVISLFVVQETSYEKGFSKSDRTYRVYTKFLNATEFASSSYNVAPILAEQPEFETITHLTQVNGQTAELNQKAYPLEEYFYIDSDFPAVFDYDLLFGVAGAAFQNENSLIVTSEEAERLFGRQDVVGEFLSVGEQRLEITGVLKPAFFKSHLQFNGLWVKDKKPVATNLWSRMGYYTYALAHKGVGAEQLKTRFGYVKKDYIFPGFAGAMSFRSGYTYEQWEESNMDIALFAQPIRSIHLNSKLNAEITTGGDHKTIWTFALIASFILIISCANFINLATAKASERTKELGIKKVLGTSRQLLMAQMLAESVLTTFIAGLGALALTELALNQMQVHFPGFVTISLFQSPGLLFILMAFVLVVGLVAGVYPALYLSSFKITALLKGQKVQGFKGAGFANVFRNTLVVIQFTLSAILIVGAIFIARQLNYMQKMDLGFDADKVMVIDNARFLGEDMDAFITELRRLPLVESVSTHYRVPGAVAANLKSLEELSNGLEVYLDWFEGSADQFKTLGVELSYGRSFSGNLESDKQSILINESAAAYFGDTEVIGATISDKKIVGVVKDFHFESLRLPVAPAMFQLTSEKGKVGVRMPTNQANIDLIAEKWMTFEQRPMEYHVLSENFEAMIQEEGQLGRAFSFFTALAIFISCLGMYGLAVFAADQRSKELSIRKVLGATVKDLVHLLIKNFLKLAVISLIVALPLSWWAVKSWLSDFAYRIDISSFIFALGALSVLGIVIITVIHQSYQAAIRNPVETLKNE